MAAPTATLENITEAECCWLADFVYDHSDARVEMAPMPYTGNERWRILFYPGVQVDMVLVGVTQQEAERTLASYRAGDDPVWVDWYIRSLEEARR